MSNLDDRLHHAHPNIQVSWDNKPFRRCLITLVHHGKKYSATGAAQPGELEGVLQWNLIGEVIAAAVRDAGSAVAKTAKP